MGLVGANPITVPLGAGDCHVRNIISLDVTSGLPYCSTIWPSCIGSVVWTSGAGWTLIFAILLFLSRVSTVVEWTC